MDCHPDIKDLTASKILELDSKYHEFMKDYIKIEIKNKKELCKKIIIVDGEWRLKNTNFNQ
ncbi:MAG: hypothetical protein H0T84_10715 [Tatlockia sp.]|nr:hypothetical protein [Tatlockia sp.]